MNVIPFKKKSVVDQLYFNIETEILEDGSVWYRFYNPLGEWWSNWEKVN